MSELSEGVAAVRVVDAVGGGCDESDVERPLEVFAQGAVGQADVGQFAHAETVGVGRKSGEQLGGYASPGGSCAGRGRWFRRRLRELPGDAAEQGAFDEHVQVGEFGEQWHDSLGSVRGEEPGDEERVNGDLVEHGGWVVVAQVLYA